MHDMPAIETVDAEIFTDTLPPDREGWYRDCRFADYGWEDGIFRKYQGYVLAIYEEKIVGKGKNPLQLRRRMAKKLGVDPLRVVLFDTMYGIL